MGEKLTTLTDPSPANRWKLFNEFQVHRWCATFLNEHVRGLRSGNYRQVRYFIE